MFELLNDICFPIISKVYLVKGQGSGLTGDRDYYDNSGNDQAFINFDLKADLSPLFNWNVKALYLYLTAEYITKENSLNEMVLWDKIVMNGEKMDLDMKSAKVSQTHIKYIGSNLERNGYETVLHICRPNTTSGILVKVYLVTKM